MSGQTLTLAVGILAMAACSSPDLSGEMTAFETATGQALDVIDAQFAREAAAERASARQRAIAAGQPVLLHNDDGCQDYLVAASETGLNFDPRNCHLRSAVVTDPLTNTGTSVHVLTARLREYAGALSALVASDQPGEVGRAVQSLVLSANAFSQASATYADAPAPRDIRAIAQPFGSVIGAALNAWRLQQVRQIAEDIHPSIVASVNSLQATLRIRTPGFEALVEERMSACASLDPPPPTASAYRAAIRRCETAQAAFAREDVRIGRAGVMALVTAHASLVEASRPGADIEAIIQFVTDVNAITAVLNGASQ